MLSARAAALITGGRLEGLTEGSRTLAYLPGRTRPGRYSFEAGTAGSISLVLQAILAPLSFSAGKSSVTLEGGTHVPWSPPSDYIEGVFLPLVRSMGISADFHVSSRGYYPGGGGKAESSIRPASTPLKPLSITERGRLTGLRVTSVVSNLPISIAERQLKSACALLTGYSAIMKEDAREAASPGRGTSVFILAEFENTRAAFSSLGARGKRAEEVGIEASEGFLEYMEKDGALDEHSSDQLLLYAALARGKTEFTTSRVTPHLLTNKHTIEAFLPVRFEVEGAIGASGSIRVNGMGLEAGFS